VKFEIRFVLSWSELLQWRSWQHVTTSCSKVQLHCRTTACQLATTRKRGCCSDKSACWPFRLCTLMSNTLTRSSFRQEHRITSVGNGPFVVVQEEEPRVGGVPPPQIKSWQERRFWPQGVPPFKPDFLNDHSISSPSPRLLRSVVSTALPLVVQSRAPGTCCLIAWRAIEEVLVLQRVLAPRLFLVFAIYVVLARTLKARISFFRSTILRNDAGQDAE
jgi:hypothetical protein